MVETSDISVADWLDRVLAAGRYSFSKEALQSELPEYSDIAVKRALNRLSIKGKVLSISKGYYLIIPPQYASNGILPPHLYLDAFMKYLDRPYYLGLLNAAVFFGSAHQKPQEYYVFTSFPVLRPTKKKGTKINYVSIKDIPEKLLKKQKTEAGYLQISNEVLTACDLIQYEKRIGGINRAVAVLLELTEVIRVESFTPELLQHTHVTALQRLGYLLEEVCQNKLLSNALYEALQKQGRQLFRIPLKPGKRTKGYSSANRWNVIVNVQIETDE